MHNSCTTVDLTFMTWNKFYCIFPHASLIKHKFYPLRILGDDLGARLAELSKQGWTSHDLVWLDFTPELPYGTGKRRIGDQYSLSLPLAPKSHYPATVPDYVTEYAEFYVKTPSEPQTPSRGRIAGRIGDHSTREGILNLQVSELSSPALLYRYAVGFGSSMVPWRQFLAERLERWTKVELYKNDPESRLVKTAGETNKRIHDTLLYSGVELPDSWEYADDLVPQWYQAWEAERKGKQ